MRNDPASVLRLTFFFGLMYFVQGIGEPVAGLVSQPVRSLLKDWGYDAAQIAGFAMLVALPWSLKPLYGLLTDFVPLAGTRRRSYLLLTTAAASLSLGYLAFFPPAKGAYTVLLAMLLVPTVSIAFTDVVVDALMVEKGQPLGLTGRLQSMQWAAIYSATILTGYIGGWLAQRDLQTWAFGICSAATAVSFLAALLLVHDDRPVSKQDTLANAARALWLTAKSPVVLAAGSFLFLWNFNPFNASVLYVYATEELHISDETYGTADSVLAVGAVLGAVAYGLYCRRVPMHWLVHVSILTGILSTVAYWLLRDQTTMYFISFAVGLTYMTASLVQLDLAARACLRETAGTTFALLMSLSNFSMSLSEGLGGWLYEHMASGWTAATAFNVLVGIGAAFTACCWLLLPLIYRQILAVEGAEE